MVMLCKVSESRLAAALSYYGVTPQAFHHMTGWSYTKCWNLMNGDRSDEPFMSEHLSKEELILLAQNIRDAPEVEI